MPVVGWRRARFGLLVVLLTGATAFAAPPQPPATAAAFPTVVLNTDGRAAGDGFTAIDVNPSQLAAVPPGSKALVWLGGYDNETCAFSTSDAQLRDEFARYELAAAPSVLGYFLADEPNSTGGCPAAPQQVRQRSALVRSLDTDVRHITLANIDDPTQFAAFRASADVISTDPYPCTAASDTCDWSMIPSYIAALRAAGIVRYMGMVQAFSGDNWRWPTANELRMMLDQWRASQWCGMIVFSWSYAGGTLADHDDLRSVLRDFNARPPVPGSSCASP